METYSYKTAQERRAKIVAHVNAMGIDEAYISHLIETFYGRIRNDKELGPIFAAIISDWEPHLVTMKAFWSSVALNSGRYSGKPVPAHQKLSTVKPHHFTTWLSIFHQTLRDTAPTPEAVDYFMEKAERIALSLQYAMFPLPELTQNTGAPNG